MACHAACGPQHRCQRCRPNRRGGNEVAGTGTGGVQTGGGYGTGTRAMSSVPKFSVTQTSGVATRLVDSRFRLRHSSGRLMLAGLAGPGCLPAGHSRGFPRAPGAPVGRSSIILHRANCDARIIGNVMRTTVAIDDALMDELMRSERGVSRSEAVRRAIQAYVRRKRIDAFRRLAGSRVIDLDWREMERLEMADTERLERRRRGRSR
jgi:Arc/MetJ family transcription regulator